jgi:hypothetical protein
MGWFSSVPSDWFARWLSKLGIGVGRRFGQEEPQIIQDPSFFWHCRRNQMAKNRGHEAKVVLAAAKTVVFED